MRWRLWSHSRRSGWEALPRHWRRTAWLLLLLLLLNLLLALHFEQELLRSLDVRLTDLLSLLLIVGSLLIHLVRIGRRIVGKVIA